VKKSALFAALLAAIISNGATAVQVKILDKTFKPASNLLAYTEFELSGEPLAEALGLDLDLLDPNALGLPTAFDYAAGIESYEYSEEAMYALNYQSTMGSHLANGPLNKARGGSLNSLTKRIDDFAKAVGLTANEVPNNIYPLSLPYAAGLPEFATAPDRRLATGERLEVVTATGLEKTVISMVPAYVSDYQSLAWRSSTFDQSFNPAAIGGIFLKEVMWSQDFLGGMHITDSDEEVAAQSAMMDRDGKHSLGVSAADGFNGLMLTEMSIDKLIIMQQQLGFDGNKLGVKFTPNYDPKNGPIWFAHRVNVIESQRHGVNAIGSLRVSDGSSTLRDTWQMLWPLAEFFAFSDQRRANSGHNLALNAIFDGAPFAAAPAVNIDNNNQNDIAASDAFSLANNLSNLVFKNIAALHFNASQGTFVTEYVQGQQGVKVSTYDAAYAIVALSIFQRAKDALPVGYASAAGGSASLQTQQGKQALAMIKAQADFIVAQLRLSNGLVADGITLGKTNKLNKGVTLESQFAAIRGLVAAFLATDDQRYKQVARDIYLSIEQQMFDPNINTWANVPGQATVHTPYTQAAISGGLRETILHLKNEEGEHEPALELQALTQRYVAWFNTVINGAMQLAEPIGDTGELMIKGDNSSDTDRDGVPQITAAGGQFGTAAAMANSVSIK